ncbi:MAG: helix-turn-helix transcriptional regulator [Actinomycetota bacterium]|nr:helix-turn-helix transcriptional regulator [Actinomycetota bacterium]
MEGRWVDGPRLKDIRERKGWLRPKLSQEAGVSVSLIKYTENQDYQPGKVMVYAIANALGVDISEFTTAKDCDGEAAA